MLLVGKVRWIFFEAARFELAAWIVADPQTRSQRHKVVSVLQRRAGAV